MLALVLLVPLEGAAQRRGVRVDAGAWDTFLGINSPGCPLDLTGTPRLLDGDLLFSGLAGTDLLAGASCQYTKAGEYKGSAYAPGEEDGLAALLGPNADQAASALRYTFADDSDVLAAQRAFQWYFHRLPDLILVSLHLSVGGDTGVALDDSTSLIDLSNGSRLWGAGSDGFDGEYFCFQWTISPYYYLGRWNGRTDDEGSYCLDYVRYSMPLRPQVASRDGRGLFLDGIGGQTAFDPRQRFVAYDRVTEPITIYGTRRDVFVFDRATGRTRQVNLRTDGSDPDLGASNVAIAPEPDLDGNDGTRWIAFSSRATGLLGDGGFGAKALALNDEAEVYLEVPDWDSSGTLRRISRAADSLTCGEPSLSAPRYDAFGQLIQSPRVAYACTDLDDGLRRSLWLGGEDVESPTRLWTAAPGETLAAPRISADARIIVFATDAPIDPSDGNGQADVYALVLATNAFERLSRAAGGGDADGPSSGAVVSGDGCVVAFQSAASNLVQGTTAPQNVFARDRCRGTTALVSRGAGNLPLGGASARPSITADGRFVAFQTEDAGVRAAAGLGGPGTAVAVHRLGQVGQTRAVQSAMVAGTPFTRSASDAVISAYNYDVSTGARWSLSPGIEGGHELLLMVEPADGEPQLAVLPSPFERVYVPVFGSGFE